ncbi:MAG: hypothetical protein ACOYXU_11220 [Nitrospirota bacterium]
MTTRPLMAVMIAFAITLAGGAEGAPPAPPQNRAPATDAATPQPAKKTKPRRVIIFGTTIVGDVLTPTIEKTVPWQRPAAFRSNAAPLTHDFTVELLTPLDRNAILREMDGHEH